MRKIVFIAVAVFLAVSLVQAKDGLCREDGFKTYEIKRGETLSEISWVLGIPMRQLVQWNGELMDQGIRNLRPGTVIKYKLPEQLHKEVEEDQKETRKHLSRLREEIKRENEKFLTALDALKEAERDEARQGEHLREELQTQGEKTRKEVSSQGELTREETKKVSREQGELTREEVREASQEQAGSLEQIKEKLGENNIKFILALIAGVIIFAVIVGVLFFFFGGDSQEEEEEKSETKDEPEEPETGASSHSFDADKLKELEEVTLNPDNEQETEFELNGYKFKVLLHYDGSYHSWQENNATADIKKFAKKKDVVKSIKQSLKHWLMGTPGDKNRIQEAIRKGKIKKV